MLSLKSDIFSVGDIVKLGDEYVIIKELLEDGSISLYSITNYGSMLKSSLEKLSKIELNKDFREIFSFVF